MRPQGAADLAAGADRIRRRVAQALAVREGSDELVEIAHHLVTPGHHDQRGLLHPLEQRGHHQRAGLLEQGLQRFAELRLVARGVRELEPPSVR